MSPSTEGDRPWWLLPNLLSLDAPLVAVMWLYIFASTWGAGFIPPSTYLALALAVWWIYAADRLIDSSLRKKEHARLEARHAFHARHRGVFLLAMAAAAAAVLYLALFRLPSALFEHLPAGLVLVAGYLMLSLLSPGNSALIRHLKNLLASAAFAYGTTMPALVHLPVLTMFDLLFSHLFILFAALCFANISAIDLWESEDRKSAAPLDRSILLVCLLLLEFHTLRLLLTAGNPSERPILLALLTGATLIHLLHLFRSRFPTRRLRVLVDAALLAPIIPFVLMRGR